jgi:quercetin dioxygenase-like cupin family protein
LVTPIRPIVVREQDVGRDGWDDPQKGRVAWRTLFSGDQTATDALTCGVAELERDGWLGLHRHSPAEIYYVLEGRGIVTLEGAEHAVSAGSAVFIPADAEHGIRNTGPGLLRFLYALPVDAFGDVEYRFSQSGDRRRDAG